MGFIYGLSCSNCPEDIRYVGKTSATLGRRLSGHKSDVRRNRNYRTNWIKTCSELVISVIEEVDNQHLTMREIYWIAEYRRLGYQLVNATDGGEGWETGRKLTKEHAANAARAAKPARQTPEYKARQSARMKGKIVSQETRAKLSKAKLGTTQSLETRAKRSASLKGKTKGKKLTEEHRAKLVLAWVRRKLRE